MFNFVLNFVCIANSEKFTVMQSCQSHKSLVECCSHCGNPDTFDSSTDGWVDPISCQYDVCGSEAPNMLCK